MIKAQLAGLWRYLPQLSAAAASTGRSYHNHTPSACCSWCGSCCHGAHHGAQRCLGATARNARGGALRQSSSAQPTVGRLQHKKPACARDGLAGSLAAQLVVLLLLLCVPRTCCTRLLLHLYTTHLAAPPSSLQPLLVEHLDLNPDGCHAIIQVPLLLIKDVTPLDKLRRAKAVIYGEQVPAACSVSVVGRCARVW